MIKYILTRENSVDQIEPNEDYFYEDYLDIDPSTKKNSRLS
jgi:hypothetical protein